MRSLPAPATADEDDRALRSACKRNGWIAHQADWLATYATYRASKADPFTVSPWTFNPDIADAQRDLYRTRASGGPIRRLRDQTGLLACPVCGSPNTGHLDHYLPRTPFAEFSLMRLNLVPACQHCNSSAKGGTYCGAPGERFIHPYFDTFASAPLWFVEVVAPFRAATFVPTPMPGFDAATTRIIRFHLDHVLGDQFQIYVANQWAALPALIASEVANGQTIIETDVGAVLASELRRSVITMTDNGWRTALLRGLQGNLAAVSYLAVASMSVPQP